MLEDVGNSSDAISIHNVESDILKKVVEFCKHHSSEPLSDPMEDDMQRKKIQISEWDGQFLSVDKQLLFGIVVAANYLDIRDLLDVGCRKIVLMIHGKSTKEIRDLFDIVNNLTPEEETAIKNQNRWAEGC
ncbi:hypothetical protein GYMLUDRAFT_78005 [Collybiopsis luxurians FD-317 M1]|uniref:E3 ubiquitin ligase complex SCF subunit n=1 Tax=Collybiopsis luxurians FD-317 M1 TaxID=944289 RepID=A0A0D0C2B0_9AGAR|nr:hypothetical protein GYMLUDRAFT_78005 [Collybiopsis luxurians FD-317 M1]